MDNLFQAFNILSMKKVLHILSLNLILQFLVLSVGITLKCLALSSQWSPPLASVSFLKSRPLHTEQASFPHLLLTREFF